MAAKNVWCPPLKGLFTPKFVQKERKKKILRKNINGVQQKYDNNKKRGVPHQGLNAMLFPTRARKCNHWATGELLEVGGKFNGTYMHMKCSFYWQPKLALEYVFSNF